LLTRSKVIMPRPPWPAGGGPACGPSRSGRGKGCGVKLPEVLETLADTDENGSVIRSCCAMGDHDCRPRAVAVRGLVSTSPVHAHRLTETAAAWGEARSGPDWHRAPASTSWGGARVDALDHAPDLFSAPPSGATGCASGPAVWSAQHGRRCHARARGLAGASNTTGSRDPRPAACAANSAARALRPTTSSCSIAAGAGKYPRRASSTLRPSAAQRRAKLADWSWVLARAV